MQINESESQASQFATEVVPLQVPEAVPIEASKAIAVDANAVAPEAVSIEASKASAVDVNAVAPEAVPIEATETSAVDANAAAPAAVPIEASMAVDANAAALEAVPLVKKDYFGPPPVIPGEDPAAYQALLAQYRAAIQPKDFFEEIWAREMTDSTWDAHRMRRLKANVLSATAYKGVEKILAPLASYNAGQDLTKRWARREPKALKEVDGHLATAGLTMDAVMAETLALKLDVFERIDRMAASAEGRRNLIPREIDRHRATVVTAFCEVAQEGEDAEFEEIKSGAAKAETR